MLGGKFCIYLIALVSIFFLSAGNSCRAFANDLKIVFIGDSLTAGYGVKEKEAFPWLVGEMIKKRLNKEVKILNGGVSGSTSASAVSRVRWYLKAKPQVMLLALGANDGLRGIDLKETKKNLKGAIDLAQKNNIKVMLGGMLLPPNYGPKYTSEFKALFNELGKLPKVKLIPFLLKEVAGEREMNQADGIHPNESGHKKIAETVFEHLKDEI